ncbi:MAG: cation diffusion facilitator family transporter [Betaproteobacteria bacterium]|nr:cation diffusion facilitator family transporter [Betaproteobacteria bacterium]MDH5222714.1 cation diffusion facilitator family transporter [Betaproteobacteria bacterium]MDH5352347.1 cation diffusion facilitator family transporter [Betaproteobacteria bacterium]
MGHFHPHIAVDQRTAGTALGRAAALTLSFAALEALGGWWTGSLALVSDAGHMLGDGAALLLAALAGWMARRAPSGRHSYGLGRAEVFAAVVNGTALLVIAAALGYEALARLGQPREVLGGAATLIALAGLALNLWILRRIAPHRHDMNARAAALHVLGDTLGSVAALVSGAVIFMSGWTPIDPLASLFICLLIAVSSLRLLREGVHALMEGVPLRLSSESVGLAMAAHEDVASVHDLHIWTLSGSRVALSAHVVVRDLSRWDRTLHQLQDLLRERFGIEHVTLQPESFQATEVRVPVPDPRRREA